MDKIEILAPAGSPESLLPAVRLGADAVYLGGSHFNARANAGNFDREALKSAVDYCHARGVNVYLTANTLVRDDELPEAMEFLEYACSLPVDALIVQDVGLASLIHAAAPKMRLHASTQMSVHTPLAAAALYDAGFSRVVLARELSLEEIRKIRAASPIELEVFVHGALCMSVSGQCYLSAMLGGRSGNRGCCAQPCRLPFAAPGGTGYDLSLKDGSAIARLPELFATGVTSAKIEGRMKRPEYVAAAVAACRLSADGKPIPRELTEKLKAVFSRSGFTGGYLAGKRGREMFGIRQKENVTAATGEVLSGLRQMYKEESPRVGVDFYLQLQKDLPVRLNARDGEGNEAAAQGEPPEPARTIPIDEERCRAQLAKTGGTPFFCRSAEVAVGEGLSLPVSSLNQLRRAVLQELEAKRAARKAPMFSTISLPKVENHTAKQPPRLRARFANAEIPDCFRDFELVYLPLGTPNHRIEELLSRGFPIAAELPRGLFGQEEWALNRLDEVKALGVRDVWAGNLGGVALGQQAGMRVHGGFGLNIFNTASVEWAEDNGLIDVECSFELTLSQAAKLGGTLPRGLIVYGRLPLMLTRNCPAANSPAGCLHCKTPPFLTDRKGARFPLQCTGGCTEILNSLPLTLADRISEIQNIDFFVFRFSVENSVETEENFQAFHSRSKSASPFTRGLYYRGVD